LREERRTFTAMTRTEFLLELDEILGLDPGTLKGHEKLEDLETWDSIALVNLIAVAESLSNTEITLDQVVSCATVADLLQLAQLDGTPN
jgi:acyl carrier protein